VNDFSGDAFCLQFGRITGLADGEIGLALALQSE
jgi:hypothetical protein